jgi:N-acetylmuramic acid 6-phosphate etherase
VAAATGELQHAGSRALVSVFFSSRERLPEHAADSSQTERRNPRTVDIDLATPIEIVDAIGVEDRGVPAAVAAERESIAKAVAIAESVFRNGGRLIYVGAGTSGRLGVLDAVECPPTFGTDPEMVQGLIAGGETALTRAVEGAEDRPEDGARDIEARAVGPGDFVVGIAASGATPYVRGALRAARAAGARTAIVACTPIADAVRADLDVAILPIVGPEVVTGSTRMKAGTATKLVLNTITTGAMIRVGKTYGNLMVDLRATNAKLAARSERIVAEVCHISRDEARRALEAAGGGVKLAIVMRARGVSRVDAERLLADAGGVLRLVIGPPPAVV